MGKRVDPAVGVELELTVIAGERWRVRIAQPDSPFALVGFVLPDGDGFEIRQLSEPAEHRVFASFWEAVAFLCSTAGQFTDVSTGPRPVRETGSVTVAATA
jgi:hypothetical protein